MTAPIVVERSRGLLRVTGRDPVRMVQGLATADIAAVTPDRGAYTVFLTAKGRMVADARVFLEPERGAAGEAGAADEAGTAGERTGAGNPGPGARVLLIDTAPDALPGLVEHLKRFVPPLFARAEDVSGAWSVVGVYGAGADEIVDTALPPASEGAAPEGGRPAGPAEGGAAPVSGADLPEEAVVPVEGGFRVRTLVTGEPGWDVFVDVERRGAVVDALLEAGARPGDADALESLRVAAGRPRWGRELTEDTIPLEAELLDRAISQGKGCYTGQEVIVRILHRGHVNRHLRRLDFSGPLPAAGAELFEEGNEKPRGVVTSAVANDAGALGLGYVRREIDPPAELRVGSPEGDPVRVTALT